jgi:hypothetical protein
MASLAAKATGAAFSSFVFNKFGKEIPAAPTSFEGFSQVVTFGRRSSCPVDSFTIPAAPTSFEGLQSLSA